MTGADTGRTVCTARIEPELVVRAQQGDPAGMQQLLRALTPYVAAWCGPIALQEGPDAAQETMIVVFRRIHQLKEPSALLGWVRTIAVREAVKVATRAGRAVASEFVDIPTREEMAVASDVRDVLARLSPEHRAVLVLRDLEDLDERSVAAVLDVSLGTVKSRLHRARRKFRDAWG